MARKTDKLAVAEFPLIDETLLKSRIYTIRGVKVMLDADLAEIYVIIAPKHLINKSRIISRNLMAISVFN